MPGFFTFLPYATNISPHHEVFDRAIASAVALGKAGQPRTNIKLSWVSAATFSRVNGTGADLFVDPITGCWVIGAGTWFLASETKSSAEILLQRYLEIGAVKLGRELQGFFTILIGDARTRQVMVITDLIGSYHCFMRVLPQGVALSGSALLLASLEPVTLDDVGCQEFLRLGVVYGGRTCFQGIQKLNASSVYRLEGLQRPQHEIYWAATELADRCLPANDAAESLWSSSVAAMRKIGGVGRIVSDLTGGYDSRLLVAALNGATQQFSTTVSGNLDHPDVRISSELAHLLRIPHEIHARDNFVSAADFDAAVLLTDGASDAAEYLHTMRVHLALSERFDISLNGSFGELARGYWWELLFPYIGDTRPLSAEMLARKRFAVSDREAGLFPAKRRVEMTDHFTQMIDQTNRELRGARNTLQMDHAYTMLRMQHWQGQIASSTNRIWPCLSPLMFRSVLEVMLTADPSARIRSKLARRMLAQYQPALARHPMEHGYPAMPLTMFTAHRFWPVVPYYSKRIWNKLDSRLKPKRPAQGGHELRHQPFWMEEDFRGRMTMARLRAMNLFDEEALTQFLRRVLDQGIPDGAVLTRMISLETALEKLEQVRRFG